MKILIFVGGFLLLLLFLLLMPVRVRFTLQNGKTGLHVYYLFLRFDLSPEKLAARAGKATEKAAKKEYTVQKKEEGTKTDKLSGIKDTIKTALSLLRASGSALNLVRHNLVFYKVRLHISVAGDDACQVAMAWGRWRVFLSCLLAVVSELFVLQDPDVSITPDFTGQQSRYDIRFHVRIQPLVILVATVRAAFAFVAVQRQNQHDRMIKKNKQKGGQKHEPAASRQ